MAYSSRDTTSRPWTLCGLRLPLLARISPPGRFIRAAAIVVVTRSIAIATLSDDSNSALPSRLNRTYGCGKQTLFRRNPEKALSTFRRQRDQQSAGGLRVEERKEPVSRSRQSGDVPAEMVPVTVSTCRNHPFGDQIRNAAHQPDPFDLKTKRDIPQASHFAGMADQTEACDIGCSRSSTLQHQLRSTPVHARHPSHCFAYLLVGGHLPLYGGRDDAAAKRLGQDQPVSDTGSIVPDYPLRIDKSGNGKSILEFVILDRMPSCKAHSGFIHCLTAAAHNLRQYFPGQRTGREEQQIQRGERAPAHCIDIRYGIGRSYPAEGERIVHQGGDYIDRLDKRQFGRDPVDSCIIRTLRPDQQ